MTGPLAQIAARYPWAKAPLERAAEAFGVELITRLAVEFEKQGTFARSEATAVDIITGRIGQELLGRQPAPLEKHASIFEPKAKAEPEDDAAAG